MRISQDFWKHLPDWTNRVYYPFYFDDKRYNVYYGGAASGKSFFVAEKIVYRFINDIGRNFLIVRKTDKDNRYSTFPLIQQVINLWGIGDLVKINKTTMTMTCLINGNQIVFRGLDNREKLKSITFERGILTDIWCEEATELEPEDFKQLKLRMRGQTKHKKQMILSFNPISELHWAKGQFFDSNPDESICSVLKTTYQHNQFLEKEDREDIERFKTEDENYYNIYALGNWGILGNVVFKDYVIEDFSYTQEDLENVCNGLDFGYVHKQALIRLGFRDNEIYVFDELSTKYVTNEDYIKRAGDYFGPGLYREDITGDSANPDKIDEWNKAGYHVEGAKKGDGSLRFGVEYLSGRRMHIHKTRCPNMAREVQTFRRREDKDGNVMEKFVEINDDCIAAARYATEWIWGQYHGEIADGYNAGDLGL
jgi:phage terminase large subunit